MSEFKAGQELHVLGADRSNECGPTVGPALGKPGNNVEDADGCRCRDRKIAVDVSRHCGIKPLLPAGSTCVLQTFYFRYYLE